MVRFGKIYNDNRVIKAKGKQENGGAGMMLWRFNMLRMVVAAQWLQFGFPLVILQLQISMQVIP